MRGWNLYLVPGTKWKTGWHSYKMKKQPDTQLKGDRVEHSVKHNFLVGIFTAIGVAALAASGAALAQDPPAKKSSPAGASKASGAAAARGKEIFEKKCAICHYADSDVKKIGPGLKDISKRGTFSINGNKVTDESLRTWIENGDMLMPPFKEVLEAPQIKDVVAYVRTL